MLFRYNRLIDVEICFFDDPLNENRVDDTRMHYQYVDEDVNIYNGYVQGELLADAKLLTDKKYHYLDLTSQGEYPGLRFSSKTGKVYSFEFHPNHNNHGIHIQWNQWM